MSYRGGQGISSSMQKKIWCECELIEMDDERITKSPLTSKSLTRSIFTHVTFTISKLGIQLIPCTVSVSIGNGVDGSTQTEAQKSQAHS